MVYQGMLSLIRSTQYYVWLDLKALYTINKQSLRISAITWMSVRYREKWSTCIYFPNIILTFIRTDKNDLKNFLCGCHECAWRTNMSVRCLPPASFRSRLAADTLAFGCILPTIRAVWGLAPFRVCSCRTNMNKSRQRRGWREGSQIDSIASCPRGQDKFMGGLAAPGAPSDGCMCRGTS